MTSVPATVFLVDDESSVLRALSRLLRLAGYRVCAFLSSEEFLAGHDNTAPGCAVVDLAMPGSNGLDLQNALAASGSLRPIVFISGHANIPSSVQAMKAGAIDFLTKPVKAQELLAAVRHAVEKDCEVRQAWAELERVCARLKTLTPREHEVFEQVVAGRLNKQIAADLGTVEKTIKVHRSRMMEKMGVHSLADLVRMAERTRMGQAGGQALLRSDLPMAQPRH